MSFEMTLGLLDGSRWSFGNARCAAIIYPTDYSRSWKPRESQELFVYWYTNAECLFNGVEASRRAGYKGNDHTLHQVGYENMRKAAIWSAIEKKIKKQ